MEHPVTDEALRQAGFTSDARQFPLSEAGFQWLCHYNGAKPEQAPPAWRYAPNAYMQRWLNLLGERNLLVPPGGRVPLLSELEQ